MPSPRALLPLLPLLLVTPASGQTDPLEKARQDALAAEQSFGPDDPRTAQAQLVLGIRQARAGQPREAKATFTRALEVFVAAKNRNGEASARLQLAGAFDQLGDRAAALEQAELGLELRRQHAPDGAAGDVALAEALNAAGALRVANGDTGQGMAWLREALSIYRQARGHEMRAAIVQANLALIVAGAFDHEQAIAALESAIELATAAESYEHRTTLRMRYQLAQVLVRSGDYERARATIAPTIDALRRVCGPNHQRTFEAEWLALGIPRVDGAEEDVVEAERLVATARTIFGDDSVQVRELHRLLASRLLHAGDAAAAHEALTAARSKDPADVENRYVDQISLEVLQALGRADDALVIARRLARDVDTRPGLVDPFFVALEKTALAKFFSRQGLVAEATPLLRSVVTDGPWSEWTVHQLECRHWLAQLLDEQGDHAAAAALDVETLRAMSGAMSLALPALLHEGRLREKQDLRACVDRLLRISAENPTTQPPAAVVGAVLAWKGQVARDLERDLGHVRRTTDEPRRRQLDRLAELSRLLAAHLRDGLPAEERRRLLDEQTHLQRALSLPGQTPPSPADPVAAVTERLAPHDALVEFLVWSDGGGERLTAFVLRAARPPQRVELGAMAPVRQAIAAHLQLLARSIRPLDAASRRLADTAARRLHTCVMSPLVESLAGAERVFFAPDGELALLPFDTLPGTAQDSYLFEQLDVRHLRSGEELTTARASGGSGLLLVDGGGTDLPEASREARTIAELWTAANRGSLHRITGTDPAALARGASGREFVHFATHGRFLRRGDGRPAGTGADAPGKASLRWADAALSDAELALFDLTGCRLVVLSACETGSGDALPGEHLLGMRRALRLAGARASITALWQIDDLAARELMERFWRRLLASDDPAAALREAKLEQLADNRRRHGDAMPGTWAAFLLDGP